jgi:hypothetical protein
MPDFGSYLRHTPLYPLLFWRACGLLAFGDRVGTHRISNDGVGHAPTTLAGRSGGLDRTNCSAEYGASTRARYRWCMNAMQAHRVGLAGGDRQASRLAKDGNAFQWDLHSVLLLRHERATAPEPEGTRRVRF